ncbi:hypothetical protein [Roseiflexus castenholzii]|uniref:Zinc finger SWIM domain protein n=1 Tax=Roseiflexus castenholzii (strain DSM 13941 / HLO8) TaxID=383372 RepID=A7NIL4_ROSCS|nr:hypothetical protein [Roseiflexus castenholzii]ABU57314.1 zinc finger SWIM domain protein [Roseiflexus castenholzii DSM 13941]
MHSDLIGKIEKARRYAEEPERIALDEITVRFHGGNNDHRVRLVDGRWTCDCEVFHLRGVCAHVMTLQKVLAPMLSADAREPGPVIIHSELISMIEKSRRYAHELDRIEIQALRARFRGNNNDHVLTLNASGWLCDCSTFRVWHTCAHVMALQRILAPMLPAVAREPGAMSIEEHLVGALS